MAARFTEAYSDCTTAPNRIQHTRIFSPGQENRDLLTIVSDYAPDATAQQGPVLRITRCKRDAHAAFDKTSVVGSQAKQRHSVDL
jgi:hypothetical protein